MSQKGDHTQEKREEAGFSLVETVAAMGILALAAIPLLEISTDATANTRYMQERLMARIVAENALAYAVADPQPRELGIETGVERQLGRDYQWTLTTTPGALPGAQGVLVEVRRFEQSQVIVRYETLKPLPQQGVLAPREGADE